MKRMILFAAVAFLSTGCATVYMTPADLTKRVEIGMSINEFKKMAGMHAELDAMNAAGSVYRIDKHNIGIPDYIVSATFFRFDSAGRLTEIETRHFAAPFFREPSNFEPLIP